MSLQNASFEAIKQADDKARRARIHGAMLKHGYYHIALDNGDSGYSSYDPNHPCTQCAKSNRTCIVALLRPFIAKTNDFDAFHTTSCLACAQRKSKCDKGNRRDYHLRFTDRGVERVYNVPSTETQLEVDIESVQKHTKAWAVFAAEKSQSASSSDEGDDPDAEDDTGSQHDDDHMDDEQDRDDDDVANAPAGGLVVDESQPNPSQRASSLPPADKGRQHMIAPTGATVYNEVLPTHPVHESDAALLAKAERLDRDPPRYGSPTRGPARYSLDAPWNP